MNDDLPIIEAGGEARKLGLLAPEYPPEVYVRLRDAMPLLSESEIRRLVDDPSRIDGRKEFAEKYTKDQDGVGACNGYAVAGAVERARERKGLERIELSGDFAYALMNGGRDQGSHLAAAMKACEEVGYCSEELVRRHGLRHEYRLDRFPGECREEAKRFQGFEAYQVQSEQELYTALALKFPVVVAVHAAGDDSLDGYGVCNWGNGPGNHSVLCDGLVYDTQMGGFKCDHQNSWNTRWGDQGRSYLVFSRHFQQSIGIHSFFAIRSASDDPQGDNPPTPEEN